MRILPIIINQMLGRIPDTETSLIVSLNSRLEENRYRAPEIQDWRGTANTLFHHLAGREEEPWVADLLDVWQDKPVKTTESTE